MRVEFDFLREKLDDAVKSHKPVVLKWYQAQAILCAAGELVCDVCGYARQLHIAEVGGLIPCEYCSLKAELNDRHVIKSEATQ